MINIVNYFKRASKEFYNQIQPQLKTLAWVGLLGMPLTYFYWIIVHPRTYDNLTIRLIGSVICIPILINKLPSSLSKHLPTYSIIALTYNLPFFFNYMLFKSEFDRIWELTTLLSLMLLMFIVNAWGLVLIIYITGLLLGFSVYALTTETIVWPESPLTLLSIYGFAFVAGSIFNHKTAIINQERINSVTSVAFNIAHELRTPLLGIKSAAVALKKHLPAIFDGYLLAQKSKLAVKPIRDSHYQRLQNITERIITETDNSNIFIDMLLINTNYKIVTQSEEVFSMATCVNNAINRYPFQTLHEKEKIHWKSSLENDFLCLANEILISHVIFNLLKNSIYSIKSANKGEIFIYLKPGSHYNELHFKDTAEGIPPQQIATIFNRFSTTKSYGAGSGIGLAFCKDVMENFGGKIRVKSEYNQFTEFSLYFPVIKNQKNQLPFKQQKTH